MSPGGKKIILLIWKKKKMVKKSTVEIKLILTQTIECFMDFVIELLYTSVNKFLQANLKCGNKKKNVIYTI